MNNTLVGRIANDLNIIKGNRESDSDFQQRVFYSAIGLNMLTVTYDYDDDEVDVDETLKSTVSMQRVLNRGNELSIIFGIDYDDVFIKTMRETYIKTGCMLHQANRLTYSSPKYSRVGDIFLTRGQLPWTVAHMSGLGTFTNSVDENILIPWDKMFCIEEENITYWFNQLEKNLYWRETYQLPENVEYANITEKTSVGYWLNRLPKNGATIYRDKRDGERQYNMIRIANPYEICPLSNWRVENQEYLRIVLALRIREGCVPVARIQRDGPIAKVKLDYLLPPPEQNLYELYSWPDSNNSRWNRVAVIEILPLLIEMLTRMGFIVDEE